MVIGGPHRAVEVVAVHLVTEHGLHVASFILHGPGAVCGQGLHGIEAALELVAQDVGQVVTQLLARAGFDGALGQWDHRTDRQPGRLQAGVRGALPGAVQAHHGLEEPQFGGLANLRTGVTKRRHPVVGGADLGFRFGGYERQDKVHVGRFQRLASRSDDGAIH